MGRKISIEGDCYTIPISLDKFINIKFYLPTEISLIDENNRIIIKHIINIYCCENIFYLFLADTGGTFEIIFLKNQKNIKIGNNIYLLDNNYNMNRSRLTLINCNIFNIFNEFKKKEIKMQLPPLIFTDNITSYQLSAYKNDLIISRQNKLFKTNSNVKEFYEKFNLDINKFYNNLMSMLNKDKGFNENNLDKLFKEHKDEYSFFKKLDLCKSKKEVKNSFNQEEYIEFFYKILIYYLLEIKSKNKAFKSIEEIKVIIDGLNALKEKLKKDSELEIYQKVFALIQYSYTIKKYENASFSYIKINDNNIVKFLSYFIL